MLDYRKEAIQKHLELKGKISTKLKDNLNSKDKLSTYYTPGVAAVSEIIAKDPRSVKNYTWTNNNVAVISNGTAVLGLGDIGPEAALPVMEGKAMLFKHFAGIDAVPIVINSKEPKDIIRTVIDIAPSFGAINLEDIAAPECFEVEKKLIENLNIPVMHDDQHGTAIVVLAGLINAMKVVNKDLNSSKIVLIGSGAAGVAITKLIHRYAPHSKIVLVDSKGILSRHRSDLNESKRDLLEISNPDNISGDIRDALRGADVFIGVSKGNLLTRKEVQLMNSDAIIFSMANPIPEIYPEEALKGGARVVATGRSDFHNQINNALVFPGIFRGALDKNVTKITEQHKINAAVAIASLVKNPSPEEIIPSLLNPDLVKTVAAVIS